jgi:hypothetical protein
MQDQPKTDFEIILDLLAIAGTIKDDLKNQQTETKK